MPKRLYRSRDDRMIWGVCGGIAKYFDIDPTLVRLITILLIFAWGFSILAYIVLAIVVPVEASPAKEPREVIRENVEEMKQAATQLGEDMRSTFARNEGAAKEPSGGRRGGAYWIALVLIVLGIFFLLTNLNIFWWFTWARFWPVILIIIGLVIILRPRRR